MARSPKRNPWDLYAAVRELVDEAKAGKLPDAIDTAGHTVLDDYVIAARGETYNDLARRLEAAAVELQTRNKTTAARVVRAITGELPPVIPLFDEVVSLQRPDGKDPKAGAAYEAEVEDLSQRIYLAAELRLDDAERKLLWNIADELIDGASPERALWEIFDISGDRAQINVQRLQDRLRAAVTGEGGRGYYDDLDFAGHDPHRQSGSHSADWYPGTWIAGLRLGEGSYETSLVWRVNQEAFEEAVHDIPFLRVVDEWEWHASGTMVAFRVSSIPNLHQLSPAEIAKLTNMQPTFMFAVMYTFARRLEQYLLLDEDRHSELEMEATTENVRDAAQRFVREGAPEDWVGDLIRWFIDNDERAIEPRDDDGGYPSEEQVIDGLRALGYLDEEEAEAS